MATSSEEVPMVRYECGVCSMSATNVVTPVSELAWLDHMETHSAKSAYKAWTWMVVPLEFGA